MSSILQFKTAISQPILKIAAKQKSFQNPSIETENLIEKKKLQFHKFVHLFYIEISKCPLFSNKMEYEFANESR